MQKKLFWAFEIKVDGKPLEGSYVVVDCENHRDTIHNLTFAQAVDAAQKKLAHGETVGMVLNSPKYPEKAFECDIYRPLRLKEPHGCITKKLDYGRP